MAEHMINGRKAIVELDSDRDLHNDCPWVAVWDGYDGAPIDWETPSDDPMGFGNTEQEALDDLMENTNDD